MNKVMTKTARILPTAILFLLAMHAAPCALAAEADASHGALVAAEPAATLLPGQYATSLLPVHRSAAEIAAEEARNAARNQVWRKRWMLSLAPLVTSQALDASSSWGMRELNPVLAGPDGRFGMKAAGIKFGMVGGLIGAEYLLVKKYPSSAKFFSIVNFSTAGVTSALAWHNYNLPGR